MITLRYAFIWGTVGLLLQGLELLAVIVGIHLGLDVYAPEWLAPIALWPAFVGIEAFEAISGHQFFCKLHCGSNNPAMEYAFYPAALAFPFLAFSTVGVARRINHGLRRKTAPNGN